MYIDPAVKEKVELFFENEQTHMGHALHIRFTHMSAAKLEATMPVSENTIQPFGVLHGGASVVLAETLASVGGWLNVDTGQKTTVGIEINANHVRPVKLGGQVTGTAVPLKLGRSIHVWEVRIVDERDKLVCISRCTLAVVNK